MTKTTGRPYVERPYAIYQIKRGMTREFGFESLELFRKLAEMPDTITMDSIYAKVYEGSIQCFEKELVSATLGRLYNKFNLEHPADYGGRSMSMGDIVKVGKTYYYCNSFGFDKVRVNKVPKTVQNL